MKSGFSQFFVENKDGSMSVVMMCATTSSYNEVNERDTKLKQAVEELKEWYRGQGIEVLPTIYYPQDLADEE